MRQGEHFQVSVSLVVTLVQAWRQCDYVQPKSAGWRRYAKPDARRPLLLQRVEARSNTAAPELAAELQSVPRHVRRSSHAVMLAASQQLAFK